jgi:hypothetical protein
MKKIISEDALRRALSRMTCHLDGQLRRYPPIGHDQGDEGHCLTPLTQQFAGDTNALQVIFQFGL